MKTKLAQLAQLAQAHARRIGQSVAVTGTTVAVSAHAALPTEVTDAIDTAGADLLATATAILSMMVGFWGVRKVGQKMGSW